MDLLQFASPRHLKFQLIKSETKILLPFSTSPISLAVVTERLDSIWQEIGNGLIAEIATSLPAAPTSLKMIKDSEGCSSQPLMLDIVRIFDQIIVTVVNMMIDVGVIQNTE